MSKRRQADGTTRWHTHPPTHTFPAQLSSNHQVPLSTYQLGIPSCNLESQESVEPHKWPIIPIWIQVVSVSVRGNG